MIVWTVIPMDGEASGGSAVSGNSTVGPEGGGHDEEEADHTKSSSVAMVLVGVGVAMLLLSLFLGLRSKKRARNRTSQPVAAADTFMDHVTREQDE